MAVLTNDACVMLCCRLQSQHLGLHPAPELYFGRGFSSEQRAVRLRRLKVEPHNVLIRTPTSRTTISSRPVTTAVPSNEPISEDIVAEQSAEMVVEESETTASVNDTSAVMGTGNPATTDDNGTDPEGLSVDMADCSATAREPTGWDGTTLDPTTTGSTPFMVESGSGAENEPRGPETPEHVADDNQAASEGCENESGGADAAPVVGMAAHVSATDSQDNVG